MVSMFMVMKLTNKRSCCRFGAGATPVSICSFLISFLTNVSRTMTDLTDNKASNTRLTSLHYKPLQMTLRFGKVSLVMVMQVYQGANRYYLNNFLCNNIN
jgi:hypothetical protein